MANHTLYIALHESRLACAKLQYEIKFNSVLAYNSHIKNEKIAVSKNRAKQATFKFAFKTATVLGSSRRSAGREFHTRRTGVRERTFCEFSSCSL